MKTWNEIKENIKYENDYSAEIVTSYFSNYKKLRILKYFPISICAKAPVYFNDTEFKKLAPKYQFFKDWKDGNITDDEYVFKYYDEILKFLNPEKVLEELKFLAYNQKSVLLCYERPFDFCHRHIVSDWLNTELGLKIIEIKF